MTIEKKIKVAALCGVLVVGVWVFVGVTKFVNGGEERRASRACVEAVRDRLRAPSTAKIQTPVVTVRGRDDLQMTVAFDAQNAFGAMLRAYAVCEFHRPFPDHDYATPRVSFPGQ